MLAQLDYIQNLYIILKRNCEIVQFIKNGTFTRTHYKTSRTVKRQLRDTPVKMKNIMSITCQLSQHFFIQYAFLNEYFVSLKLK